MKTVIAFALATLMTTTGFADPTGEPQYKHAVIKNHGGTVVLPDAAQQPKKNSKVILDITADKVEGGVILGLDRAALILNQYTEAGVGIDNGLGGR